MSMHEKNLNDMVKAQRDATESDFSAQVDKLAGVASQFGHSEINRGLISQVERLRSESFEIMVAGRFKVGKSTFLNALLTSTSRQLGIGGTNGPLPVDTLPCTAVLTRIEYSEQPFVQAIYFDGRVEHWTFDRYDEEARLYGEGASADNGDAGGLAEVARFTIGLPVELLRNGLVLVDSPGVSEDARRTATARGALGNVHAGIVMLRSDALAGMDEIDFALEVVEQTGRTFPVVNMFRGDVADERFLRVLEKRTEALWTNSDPNKMEEKFHTIDCRAAFEGYLKDDPDIVRRSGIQKLERRLAQFLVSSAYFAKVRAAVDGALAQKAVISEEVARHKIALTAETEVVQAALDGCDADMAEIRQRRDEVKAILARMTRRVVHDAQESYSHMCREMYDGIESWFADRPITSLSSFRGKMSSLVSKEPSKEAAAIVSNMIQQHVRKWAEAPPHERGLQRDLAPAIESTSRELDEQFRGIDARLQDISLKISSIDLAGAEPTAAVSLAERLTGLGLTLLLFPFGGGLFGAIVAGGGLRAAGGGMIGAIATKVGLTIAATVFGISFAPVALVAMFMGILTGGIGGALYGIEKRIRDKALKPVREEIRRLMTDQASLDEIRMQVESEITDHAEKISMALNAVLLQQEQSLTALRKTSGASLDEKRAMLGSLTAAEATIDDAGLRLAAIKRSAESEKDELAA